MKLNQWTRGGIVFAFIAFQTTMTCVFYAKGDLVSAGIGILALSIICAMADRLVTSSHALTEEILGTNRELIELVGKCIKGETTAWMQAMRTKLETDADCREQLRESVRRLEAEGRHEVAQVIYRDFGDVMKEKP